MGVFMENFDINLKNIDLKQLVTDDDFEKEAEKQLPLAIEKIAEGNAQIIWDKLYKSFENMPGLKLSGNNEKRKFIEESKLKYAHDISLDDKIKIKKIIVEKIKKWTETL